MFRRTRNGVLVEIERVGDGRRWSGSARCGIVESEEAGVNDGNVEGVE